jgi:hypothetical protein
MTKTFFLLILTTICLTSVSAQQLRYGFKTGLNFARINGPSETANGQNLESWQNTTGFHIGIAFDYEFTDNFGVRGEALYSKRGGNYTYNGPSYRSFTAPAGVIRSTGNADYRISVNNSYIDIPLTAVAKWGKLEVSAGAYAGLLVQSNGEGSLAYTRGVTAPPANARVDSLGFLLNHNYRRDDPGESKSGSEITLRLQNNTLQLPGTLGAYYDYPEDKGSLYRTLDYGIVGGLSFYLTSSLYVHGRLQYGLADVTNNKADASRLATNPDGSLIFRDDKDQNWNISVSVGFKF